MIYVCRFKLDGFGAFAADIAAAQEDAVAAGDPAAATTIRSLWLDYFEVELPKRGRRLAGHLQSLAVWKIEQGWTVFKTTQAPCIAFTYALIGKDVELIALGACYQFPNGNADDWWSDVIQPRVQQL